MNVVLLGTFGLVRISVIGTGYLGATHAACLVALGHDVVGVDTDPRRIERLARGEAPFHEPALPELLRSGVRSERLRFDTDYDSVAGADVHFLCVGTPQHDGSEAADLSYLWQAVAELAPRLDRPTLVVGKSTVPVGTARQVAHQLRGWSPAGEAAATAWNPEFLREGQAVTDSLHPDRLVFGVERDEDDQTLREVYAPLVADGTPVVRTDLETAELAKASANVMLAARVSLVNLLAEVCERSGADIGDLTEILGLDDRIGPRFLRPGLGYGGGCLPKDTRAFMARAGELGLKGATGMLREVDALNLRQRSRTVTLVESMLDGSVAGREIAVLGAAFKAGSDDVRDSPALAVTGALAERGARLRLYDPQALRNAVLAQPFLCPADSVDAACRGADLVLVLTDWDEFAGIDPVALLGEVRSPLVLDARLVLDPAKWGAAGWNLRALGRGGTAACVS